MTTTAPPIVFDLPFQPKTIRLARALAITEQPNSTVCTVTIDQAEHTGRGDRIRTAKATGLGRAGWLNKRWTGDMFARTIPYSSISDVRWWCL